MLLQELREPDEALPLGVSALDGLRGQHAVATTELVPKPFALHVGLRIRHGLQQGVRLRLVCLGDGIQHVDAPVGPAALFGGSGRLLGQRRSDPPMTI